MARPPAPHSWRKEILMSKWIDYETQREFTDWSDLCDRHNADCDAYEARIAELEARIARIAALVSLPGWADIVESGGRLELTTQRLDAIRAILEEDK
jgi:hypothetical protein